MNSGSHYRHRGIIGVKGDEVGREDGEALMRRRGAVVEHVDALQQFFHFIEILAVRLVELDTLRHIISVAAEEVIAADYLVPHREHFIGEMAAEKAGNPGYKNFLRFHVVGLIKAEKRSFA